VIRIWREPGQSALVASGKGVYLAVGRNPIHPAFADRLITLPLRETSAVTEVHVAWRRDEQAKAAMEFVQFTRNQFIESTPIGSQANLG